MEPPRRFGLEQEVVVERTRHRGIPDRRGSAQPDLHQALSGLEAMANALLLAGGPHHDLVFPEEAARRERAPSVRLALHVRAERLEHELSIRLSRGFDGPVRSK